MSDEIVSLFTLMDSHLSRTRLDETSSENVESNKTLSASSSLLPNAPKNGLNIPNFFPGNSPIKDFLAEQISNTLKAKEKRKQEEEKLQKVEEEMRMLKIRNEQLEMEKNKLKLNEDKEYLIDLTAAIIPRTQQTTTGPQAKSNNPKIEKAQKRKHVSVVLSKNDPNVRYDTMTGLYKPFDPTLPCTMDMSYIVINNAAKQKSSKLAKVICSKNWCIRNIYIPYEEEKVDTSNVEVFDFKTKSPGDLYKEYLENQRKPKMSTRWTVDIMDWI